MLNNGQKIFVPNYGAGIVKYLEDTDKFDSDKKYISISFLLNDIDLFIPEDKVECYKIRNVENKENMENLLKIIKEKPLDIEKKWSKRYRENNEKIKSGQTIKLCEVIRDLCYLRSQGTLPSGERKILINAESMLASEIMLSFNITMEDALVKIRNLSK